MKSLRKSLNGTRDTIRSQISTPLPSVSKPPSSISPPQKVIRALSSYRSQAPQELSFQKGDFFYVPQDVQNSGSYYIAHNPVSGARGLVPRSMFEEFNKSNAAARASQGGALAGRPLQPIQPDRPPSTQKPKMTVFYAVVLHDFEAERPDELDAKRGDTISVVAQSNREWFVAKSIGKVGRPGLIPVSFVEVRDPTTGNAVSDVNALMESGDVPKVEDWKRAMFNYKQNHIALGSFDSPYNPNRDTFPGNPQSPISPLSAQGHAIAADPPTPSPTTTTPSNPDPSQSLYSLDTFPEGALISANVISFHYEMEEFWFRIDAVFQPYAASGMRSLPPAKQLVLFRVYDDFHYFQVSLLNTFPREAGREPPHQRILPYMPGHVEEVNQQVTASRRVELNDYLCRLCELGTSGARYILEATVVREFLVLKPGDISNDIEPRVDELEALFPQGRDPYMNELQDGLGRLKVGDRDPGDKSDGSDYEDEGYAASPQRKTQDTPYGSTEPWNDRRPSYAGSTHSLRYQAHAQNHQRNESPSPYNRASSPYSSTSRSNSPLPNNGSSYPHSTSTSSLRSSQASSFTGRSRSHSTATSNLTNPTISAANSQTAFVKIKIFDRIADDLIAIRVHPKVTHAELLEKVQSRLGGDVSVLKYRDSLSNQFVGVDSDQDLRSWMEGTDKYVLYAD